MGGGLKKGRGKKQGRGKRQELKPGQSTSSNRCTDHLDLYKRFPVSSGLFCPSDVLGLLRKGTSLLHSAAREGDTLLDIAQIILTCGCIPINSQSLGEGEAPLYIASSGGHIKMVKLFLGQKGIDVNIGRKDRMTRPLIAAIVNGHLEVVKLLLACDDIDLNLKIMLCPCPVGAVCGHDGQSALSLAQSMNHTGVVEVITDHMKGRGKNQELKPDQSTSSNSCQGHLDLYMRFAVRSAVRSALFRPSAVPGLLRKGITLLHSAAREDIALDIAQILLDCGCIPINSQTLDDGQSPLYIASSGGQVNMVKLFLEQEGIDVNIGRKDRRTPLIAAIVNGHLEVVKLLLACDDIDVNLADVDGAAPLDHAANHQRKTVIQMLLTCVTIDVNRQCPSMGYTPLHHAIRLGCADVVRVLVERKVDPNLTTKSGFSALLIAADMGHVEVVKILLGCVGIDINKRDSRGCTPLIMAVANGRFEVTKMLLESNFIVDINLKENESGRSALLIASGHTSTEYPKIVEILLKYKGIDVNQQCKDGINPLMAGCIKGSTAIVSDLLSCKDIDLNMKDEEGRLSLYYAVWHGHKKVVEMLLDQGVDVNVIDKFGQTVLHLATKKGNTDVVEMLLDKGVDVNVKDTFGQTALHFAQNRQVTALGQFNRPNHPKIAKMITKHIHFQNKIKREQPEIQCEAEMQEAITAFDMNGQTALHLATQKWQPDVVKMLLDEGVDVNVKDKTGQTALHISTLGPTDVVKMLLDKGVDVNVKGINGQTALHIATRNGRSPI